MKRFFCVLACVALLGSCNNATNKTETTEGVAVSADQENVENLGKIEFENRVYEFGTIKEGEIVEHVFKFKNTGKAPIILAQVSASCGCTTPDYTQDPILPGAEGEIKASFNSANQAGLQQKIITISSNADTPVVTVELKGTVEK